MSTKRSRRYYTTEQKVEILRRHLADKVPVSELCNELGLQPSVFYQWQRQALANLGSALSTTAGPSVREKELVAKVTQLEAKLVKKDGVIAELASEYTRLKKEGGEP